MSIHILFSDGSNPYLRYNMTTKEFVEEIKKWRQRFDLEYINVRGSIYYFVAKQIA